MSKEALLRSLSEVSRGSSFPVVFPCFLPGADLLVSRTRQEGVVKFYVGIRVCDASTQRPHPVSCQGIRAAEADVSQPPPRTADTLLCQCVGARCHGFQWQSLEEFSQVCPYMFWAEPSLLTARPMIRRFHTWDSRGVPELPEHNRGFHKGSGSGVLQASSRKVSAGFRGLRKLRTWLQQVWRVL